MVGFEIIVNTKIVNILFVFGLLGMIMGSVNAILENDIRRMIAFSSVAQIGYIYMGFGLGTTMGIVASIFTFYHTPQQNRFCLLRGLDLQMLLGEVRNLLI